MLLGLSNLSLGLGASAGAVLAGLVVFTWAHLSLVPAAKEETRAVVEAEAERRTIDAIATVSDAAERARAMRRYCAARELRYDFAANECGR